jgi:N-sulfoglucosamine sulfohydrolase
MKFNCLTVSILLFAIGVAAQSDPLPNIALIAVDDMLYNTPECFGGEIAGLTPNIDRLAQRGMRFNQAYNTSSRCAPSRGSMMTGQYQDNYNEKPGSSDTTVKSSILTIPELLKERGYLTGLFGKDTHYKPIEKYNFDHVSPMAAMAVGRSPELYAENVDTFIGNAKKQNRPFFISVNTHDPHRPFAGAPGEKKSLENRFKDEIKKLTVKPKFILPPEVEQYSGMNLEAPRFVPDHAWVREEFGYYINSSHRADLFVGEIIATLERNQVLDNTLVIFLSDNGIHWPFAKSNVYVSSVKTPMIIYWNGHTVPATSTDSLVSTIDILPTILEATASHVPYPLPGKSVIPLLTSPNSTHHASVFATINKKGDMGFEMRSVIGEQFIYIYNKWADGKNQFYNGKYSGGLALKGFEEAAKENETVRDRLTFFYSRTPEELYDYKADPDALNNLLDQENHNPRYATFRQNMQKALALANDPFLKDFEKLLKSKTHP